VRRRVLHACVRSSSRQDAQHLYPFKHAIKNKASTFVGACFFVYKLKGFEPCEGIERKKRD